VISLTLWKTSYVETQALMLSFGVWGGWGRGVTAVVGAHSAPNKCVWETIFDHNLRTFWVYPHIKVSWILSGKNLISPENFGDMTPWSLAILLNHCAILLAYPRHLSLMLPPQPSPSSGIHSIPSSTQYLILTLLSLLSLSPGPRRASFF
jgi:hypothetical protein